MVVEEDDEEIVEKEKKIPERNLVCNKAYSESEIKRNPTPKTTQKINTKRFEQFGVNTVSEEQEKNEELEID